ncbi:MAG: HNH endonuclease [Burkholderiaceae bacterium]
MGKQTEASRIRIASRYLRAVRGKPLRSGESPIKLAVQALQENHHASSIAVSEKNIDYLDRHKGVMLEVISANKNQLPKRSKRAKPSFLESYEWRKVRMEALLKYGPKCMCCGATPATGAVMHVDHIKPRLTHPELALEIDNLQILCGDCNHGKGNWDQTDWRGR